MIVTLTTHGDRNQNQSVFALDVVDNYLMHKINDLLVLIVDEAFVKQLR
jgi:hypothetical protein